jgi:glutaredoxin
MKKIIFIIFLSALILPMAGRAEANPAELYFFEGQGCQHCARMKSFLEGLKVDYPNLTVKDFEVYFDKENQDLFKKMAAVYNTDSNGVPTIFIGDEVVVGENYEKLKKAVDKCSTEVCPSPADKLAAVGDNVNSILNTNQPVDGQNEAVGRIVIGVVLAGGIVFIIFIIKKK